MDSSRGKVVAAVAVLVVLIALVWRAVGSDDPDHAAPRSSPTTATRTNPPEEVTPVERAEGFEQALVKGDCAAVKRQVLASDDIDCAELANTTEALRGVDVDEIDYTLVFTGNDAATVRVTIDGERQNVDLVKAEGDWFVIFDTEV